MRIGISSFAFGWAVGTAAAPAATPFTADSLLDFAIAQRVPAIQFGDNLPLHAMSDADLRAFAARARQNGVAIEAGARGLTREHLGRYLEVCGILGARLLRFVIDAKPYEPSPADVVRLVRDALPDLERANVVLGIENHDRFPCATLAQMMAEIGSRHVGICLDTANSLGAGEGIREVLAHLAPVCVNLHLKDFAIERLPYLMGFTISGRSLGQGMLPLEDTIRAVASHGRCDTAVIETWPPPEADPAATIAKEARWAAESVEVLRAALARLASRAH